jgi:hypothetical protein
VLRSASVPSGVGAPPTLASRASFSLRDARIGLFQSGVLLASLRAPGRTVSRAFELVHSSDSRIVRAGPESASWVADTWASTDALRLRARSTVRTQEDEEHHGSALPELRT